MKDAARWLHRGLALLAFASHGLAAPEAQRRPVPREHPRLLGTADDLRTLARQRPQEYQRVVAVARNEKAEGYAWMISAALVAAIDGDRTLAGKVQQRAMQFVNGPIRRGHTPFATDLALCGLAYDLCHEVWAEADQRKLHHYMERGFR